jgi:cytochrome oxidase Cu insertion factor (SCO1/SenC/PrrC family)
MKLSKFILLAVICSLALTATAAAQAAKSRTEPLAAGALAPDFALTASDGRTYTLSKAGKPVVLVFYRGYW